MARYIKIENGKAVNAIELDTTEAFPDWVLVRSDSADIGDEWDGSAFVVPTKEELDAIAAEEAARAITAARAALIRQIDADTDAIYRAVQGDRAMEYLQAEQEARQFKKDGYTGDVPDSVESWASAKGETATWATDDILTTARGWRQAQSSIRATRLTCKERARVESDLAPIAAAWAGFAVAIKTALGV